MGKGRYSLWLTLTLTASPHSSGPGNMRVGSRIVFLVLILALGLASKKEGKFVWADFYEYFIMLNAANWLTMLISKEMERVIMKIVRGFERKVIEMSKWIWKKVKATAVATILFVRARMRETEFPPILDV